jgi:hypothetical protein
MDLGLSERQGEGCMAGTEAAQGTDEYPRCSWRGERGTTARKAMRL